MGDSSKKEKINRNTIPEGFTPGLAVYDALPVLLFGISVILLGTVLKSRLFVLGAVLCFWAGFTKVLWKIIVVIKRKNIWWMFMQMRICMPIGFVLMIVAGIMCQGKESAGKLWKFAVTFPVSLFFIIGIIGLILMGIAAAKLDSADAKSNWIEQTINTIAQLSILSGVIFLASCADYYPADETAKAALISDEKVLVEVSDGEVIFRPAQQETDTALIFYPGGKVEYLSYAPLLKKLAVEGITCILTEMPLNFAFLDSDKAADVIKEFPEIKNWYLAGHSLGGVFGSFYVSKLPERFAGVILLGSYSTKSLKETKVLSIYGSEDGVIRRDAYEKNKANLPADFTELVIDGGNHAMFGSYGIQSGDGKGLISYEEQWDITASAILDFIQ